MIANNYENIISKLCANPEIDRLIKTLSLLGQVYLVGGVVRDALRGLSAKDLDLACNLEPEKTLKILEENNFKVVPTGIAHGTIAVVLETGNVEITTFRQAGSRDSNKYAENIETDLLGRDFTINAIAYSCKEKKLIDPYNGQADLNSKILRSPGDANARILEDPLRIMRMLRFGPGLGLTCDIELKNACRTHANLLKNISPERIQHELVLILLSPFVRNALIFAHECQIFDAILPELLPSVDCLQNDFHIEDVFQHTLTVVERSENTPLQRLTALFHDLGKPATLSIDQQGRRHFYKHEEISAEITETVMQRLRFSKQITQSVKKLVSYHMRPLDCGPAAIRRLMRDLSELFEQWLLFKQADKPPTMTETDFQMLYEKFISLYTTEVTRAAGKPYGKLAITGSDLIAIGIKPGPSMGKIMAEMEEQVLENPDRNTYDYLIELAKLKIAK